MPSTTLKSNVSTLIALLPTLKEAMLAKQGLRAIRDALLYRHGQVVINLQDQSVLQSLGVTVLLQQWLQSESGKGALDDLREQSEELLKAFDQGLKEVEQVRLILAYTASTDDLVRFHTWFRSVLNKPVLLDMQQDPSLVAGFTAMVGSRFVDASIKDKLPVLEEQVVANFRKL